MSNLQNSSTRGVWPEVGISVSEKVCIFEKHFSTWNFALFIQANLVTEYTDSLRTGLKHGVSGINFIMHIHNNPCSNNLNCLQS